ncbi:MAG TPA: TetR/AcrR family transcriptional regulator [Candidatus Dormibacteraeota bacterium]|nr:TetR/AcrR family transcriptional regulator [Candidatus Dormibacteraeota bacterium]
MAHPAPAQPPAGRDTRHRILEAAALLFRDRGYDVTTMRAIALRVGITSGALYWHFPSKADILFAFLEQSVTEALAEVEKAIGESTPTEQLAYLVRTHVRLQLAELELSRAYGALHGMSQLASRLPNHQLRQHKAVQRRWLDFVRGILRAGVESGEFRALDITPTAFVIITLCDYAVTWFRPEARLGGSAVADLYADLVLRMVRATETVGGLTARE